MRKLIIFISLFALSLPILAQDSLSKKERKQQRKEERRKDVDAKIKQEEEGVLVYSKQSAFGIRLRTNGYGIMYELGRAKTQTTSILYSIELDETKHKKEQKQVSNNGFFFGNPFIYGKKNNFYNLKLGIARQHILGQKGNRNGIAVTGLYGGGLAIGLLKPYYIRVNDGNTIETIKYTPADSARFVDGPIDGGAGFGKGWNELKFKPGIYAKTAIRFDWGRYNEMISAAEIGLSIEYYTSKIPQMVLQKENKLFLQGHIAILFGRRK